MQPKAAGALTNDVLAPQQNRNRDLLIDENLAGAQDLRLLTFGKNHTAWRALRLHNHRAHHAVRFAEQTFQALAVFVQVHRLARDAAVHRGLGDRPGFADQNARIEGLRNNIRGTELDALHAVSAGNGIGDVFTGQSGQRVSGGEFHLIVDGSRPHIQSAPEDEWKPEDVIHLVWKIGAARRDDRVRARLDCYVVRNFRIGIRERENDRPRGHFTNHVRGNGASGGKAEEDVRAIDRVSKGAHLRRRREALLVGIHAGCTAFVDNAVRVAHQDIFAARAQTDGMLRAGDGTRARAVEDDADLSDVLTGDN